MSAAHPQIVDVRFDYPGTIAVVAQNVGDEPLGAFMLHLRDLTNGGDHADFHSFPDLSPGEQCTFHVSTQQFLSSMPPEGHLVSSMLEITVGGQFEGSLYNTTHTTTLTIDHNGHVVGVD